MLGRGKNTQAEFAVLDAWAAKPSSIDWAVAAAAGVAGETSERGLRLLDVKAGDTLFVDGGAGGVGAVAVQMAAARGARVIASASEANQDYLREIGATPVRYGEGMVERVRAAAGGPVDAVFDVAGKTPVEELIGLAREPAQGVSIANFAAGQAGARVTGGGADSHPMRPWRRSLNCCHNKLVIKVQTFPFDRAADAYRIIQAATFEESSSGSLTDADDPATTLPAAPVDPSTVPVSNRCDSATTRGSGLFDPACGRRRGESWSTEQSSRQKGGCHGHDEAGRVGLPGEETDRGPPGCHGPRRDVAANVVTSVRSRGDEVVRDQSERGAGGR